MLSRGIGKKHSWELDKRNREHTGPEDIPRALSGIRGREDKELMVDQVLEQHKVGAGTRVKQEEIQLHA